MLTEEDSMNILDILQSVGVAGALIFSGAQTELLRRDANKRTRERREESALELHRDFTVDGEAAAASRRLSISLRAKGTAKYGATTWLTLSDADLQHGGGLDHSSSGNEQDYADLYRILWFLERVYTTEELNLIDRDLLFQLAGFNIWWWNQILRGIRSPTVMVKVVSLAISVEEWATPLGKLDEWSQSCESDFDNGGPVKFVHCQS